jgi:hypothetical protein
MINTRFLSYFYYCRSSRSRFDIHSPFVYKLYSQVLKDGSQYPFYQELKNRFSSVKPIRYYRLLYRLSKYFKPEMIFFKGQEGGPEQACLYGDSECQERHTGSPGSSEFIHLAFVDLQLNEVRESGYFSKLLQHTKQDSVLVIWNLRESGMLRNEWIEIQEYPSVKVTIDLYRMGLVFFRDELSKENFVLRF